MWQESAKCLPNWHNKSPLAYSEVSVVWLVAVEFENLFAGLNSLAVVVSVVEDEARVLASCRAYLIVRLDARDVVLESRMSPSSDMLESGRMENQGQSVW